MERVFKKMTLILLSLFAVAVVLYVKLQPFREYKSLPPYEGTANFDFSRTVYDPEKKTVLIMADNEMTELFDLLTPFYLFSETGKANVFIAAQQKYPVLTENGPFILPHFTYTEFDSLKILPDVIVIPYMHAPESPEKVKWIRKHYNDSVLILSICDGAWTAAASGLYDGLPMTSHATGHEKIKAKYPKPMWVQNVRFAQSGNLFSTGGVSNATDGSLVVIGELFGAETMKQVMKKINYPLTEIQNQHKSISLNSPAIFSALNKVLFKQNKNIGILMHNGVNEMELGAMFDIYSRTMPSTIQGVTLTGNSITSRHGLTIITTDKIIPGEIDELHILSRDKYLETQLSKFNSTRLVTYENLNIYYVMDLCLGEIAKSYGDRFQNFVKLTLDYN